MTCIIDGCSRRAEKRRMCGMHYRRWWRTADPGQAAVQRIIGDDEARFMAKVDLSGPIAVNRPDLGRCWLWQASQRVHGYSQFRVGNRSLDGHRWAYEHFVGPVPAGLVLDHFACDNGALGCVNPHHVRPVTRAENVLRSETAPSAVNARKTHCLRGHEFTPENTYVHGRQRQCKTCNKARGQEFRLRRDLQKAVA